MINTNGNYFMYRCKKCAKHSYVDGQELTEKYI